MVQKLRALVLGQGDEWGGKLEEKICVVHWR